VFAHFGLTVTAAALLAAGSVVSPVSSTTATGSLAQMSTISMADVQLSAASGIVQLPSLDASVLLVDGTDLRLFNPSPVGISFKCLFCAYEYIEEIMYPRDLSSDSEEIGVQQLMFALDRVTGEVLTVGFSQGANVNKKTRKELVENGDLSRVNELTFFDYGAPGFLEGPDSPFTTVKVAFEYDGVAVWPSNPFDLLAYANALKGATEVHPRDYETADINALAKWVKVEDNTTYVVLHNDNLPIISRFAYAIGIGEFIERILRPGIDRSYRWEKNGFVKVTGPVIDVTAPVGEARFAQESAPSLMMAVDDGETESDSNQMVEDTVSTEAAVEETPPVVDEETVTDQPAEEQTVVEESTEEAPESTGVDEEESHELSDEELVDESGSNEPEADESEALDPEVAEADDETESKLDEDAKEADDNDKESEAGDTDDDSKDAGSESSVKPGKDDKSDGSDES
jgi:diacyltrehalose acyltransferase